MPPTNIQFNPVIESIPTFSDGILLTLYGVTVIYLIFTAILYYHWQQYSTNKKVTWVTFMLYLGTTVPLMFIMSILAFTI